MMQIYKRTIVLLAAMLMCMAVALAQQSTKKHIVKRGETIETIAKTYNVSVADIVKLNPAATRYIYIGMELLIPDGQATVDTSDNSEEVEGQPSPAASPVTTVPISSDGGGYLSKGQSVEKRNRLMVGPKVGLMLGSMTQPKQGNLFDGSGTGFEFGVEGMLRLGQAPDDDTPGTGYVGISLGVSYGSISFPTHSINKKSLSISSLSIPVSVRLYPFVAVGSLNSLYIEAGVSVFSILSSSPENIVTDSNDYTVQFNLGDNLKSTSITPLLGVGYGVPGTGLGISLRYNLGVSEISKSLPSKLGMFEIAVSWMFDIKSL